MNNTQLNSVLADCCNDITFSFNGKPCGVFPVVENSKPTYSLCYGDKDKDFTDLNTMMKDPFFDGMSLEEIVDKVEIQCY